MFLAGILFIAVVLAAGVVLWFCCGFGIKIRMQAVRFEESAKPLDNPNRGFYHIYKFVVTDDAADYAGLVSELYRWDTDTSLTLVEICLQNYREGRISKAGMENIAALFDALETVDKQLIVRFAYDLEGRNMIFEPQSLETILRHMEQAGFVLREHSGQIFVVQGLFVGNWGEMHGSRYLVKEYEKENLRRLADKLEQVTDDSTYLAVRTPVQWRIIAAPFTKKDEETKNRAIGGRLGLFNDGMLANQSDYGTYSTTDDKVTDPYEKWNREDELAFQDMLCKRVPNGGEVVLPNPYNDIDQAVADMGTMHVTYINRDYDETVFEKWKNTAVAQAGCFDGMDGLTFVERHLGYRLFIEGVDCERRFFGNRLYINITMKNVGFAPIYREPVKELKLYEQETGRFLSVRMEDSLGELSGGNDAQSAKKLCADVELGELSAGTYTLYLCLTDPATGKHIQLANEQEEEEYGYRLGELAYR